MVFQFSHGCELKNWCLQTVMFERRLQRVPWTTTRSNQATLKDINPEYSLGGLILKLKLPYFGYLMGRPTHWKDPDAGEIWRQVYKGWQRNRWLDDITEWMDMSLSKVPGDSERTGMPGMLQSIGSRVGYNLVTEL